MNKEKVLINLWVFLSSLCFIISIFTKMIVPTILALAFAIIAQKYHRKWYPRKNRSYKEILQEKYHQAMKEKQIKD